MGRHSKQGVTGRRTPVLVGVAALVAVVLVLVLVLVLDLGRTTDRSTAEGTERAGPTTTAEPSTTTTAPTTSPSPGPTTSLPPLSPDITLAFAGDVHFTGRTAGLLDDPATAFGPIASTLAAADVAMVNLETAITGRGAEEPKEFHFRAPPISLDALAAAGVDVASLANNHAVDYGTRGLRDTLEAASSGRLPVVGIGQDAAQAYAPYRTEVRGVGLAFFAASQVPDRTYQAWTATGTSAGIASTADQERLLAGVRESSAAGDVVVVYLHWGIEGDACPTTGMADLAAALAEAGADAIVGTHSHLMLGAGWLPGSTAYVAYGLGNFVWWRTQAVSDDTGVLTLTVRDGVVASAELTPAVIDGAGRPQPVVGPGVTDRQATFGALRGCTTLRAGP